LSLARLGSLDYALDEYKRFGLRTVRHDEDIMALGARLSKDLYLANTGKTAIEHARDSAAKYEAAFKDSQGYYSGINAATMALAADMPSSIIIDRVHKVRELLPPTKNLTPEDHYFIEATRAECFLILGEYEKARLALRGAIAFDPLNYPAHAGTLKQFKLILDKRGESQTWLNEFRPPAPLHYAGHIWGRLEQNSEDLSFQLSDYIQRHDIGFGFGALAAGADIIIAEALLAEGAELNVILPASVDHFIEHSVRPFGEDWVARFNSCLNQAHSCSVLSDTDLDQNEAPIILSAQMAMGQAILRGSHLDVSPIQLLIFDPSRKNSLTALHAQDWTESGLQQLRLEAVLDAKLSVPSVRNFGMMSVLAQSATGKGIEKFATLEAAISYLQKNSKSGAPTGILHFDLPGAEDLFAALSHQKLENTILVSEAIAGYAALKHKKDYNILFAGTLTPRSGTSVRSYTLQPF